MQQTFSWVEQNVFHLFAAVPFSSNKNNRIMLSWWLSWLSFIIRLRRENFIKINRKTWSGVSDDKNPGPANEQMKRTNLLFSDEWKSAIIIIFSIFFFAFHSFRFEILLDRHDRNDWTDSGRGTFSLWLEYFRKLKSEFISAVNLH